jgi:error-prone DNA polymerase
LRDFWLRTGLSPSALRRLAEADAFTSLGLSRREALWALRALRRTGDKDDLPLFARARLMDGEPDAKLPVMGQGEEVIEDYRHLSLSVKAHPLSFLRRKLAEAGVLPAGALAAQVSGRPVRVAGLVLVRQHPGSAKSIFMTLEDESGIANIIVWPHVFERFRPIVMGARLVAVSGRLQSESGVIHVLAESLEDLTPLLRHLAAPEASSVLAEPGDVMPKGRNFH